VLPIGGLKEKMLAAHRAGIATFVLPRRNAKDLTEVPAEVRDGMETVQVERMEQILALALLSAQPAEAETKTPKRAPRKRATNRTPAWTPPPLSGAAP
jgi:ATP-dependent Lon protease